MTSGTRIKGNKGLIGKLELHIQDYPKKSQLIREGVERNYPLSDFPDKAINSTVIKLNIPTVPKHDTTTAGAGYVLPTEQPMRQVTVFEGTQIRAESYAGPITSNEVILNMHKDVRKSILEVADDLHKLCVLLKLCQLPLTSKDDFDYSVIGEAYECIRGYYLKMSDALDGMISYYSSRAQLIGGVLDQPHVLDMVEAVRQTDAEEWRLTRQRLQLSADCYDLSIHTIQGIKGKLAGTDGPMDGYGYQ